MEVFVTANFQIAEFSQTAKSESLEDVLNFPRRDLRGVLATAQQSIAEPRERPERRNPL